ncbi:Cysteine protease atg4 [Trapelia coarctata]|nr:Cysteine protease atg4 [Trapelia coarctata]
MANVDFGRYKRIVQYFWDPEPKNDDASQPPIWCLGQEYTANPSTKLEEKVSTVGAPESDQEPVMVSAERLTNGEPKSCDPNGGAMTTSGGAEDKGWPKDFVDDFEARFWFTYRSHFSPIKKSSDLNASSSMSLTVRLRSQLVDQGGFTSDTGWGCMIRSGQCLLANALGILNFGRAWRRGEKNTEERHLLAMFADDPKAPFSIHNFVAHGASACDIHPGEWFGPSATASCIQALSKGKAAGGLKVYVTGDGSDVYEDTFMKLAKEDGKSFRPVLILVGIRLGIDRVTPVYWDALKLSLQLPQSIGIAGGRPSSSHYFVGVQGENFFYFDPHQTRPALLWHEDSNDYTTEEISSCHTRRLRRLHIKDMDPSMLIAFLIRDESDWRRWRQAIAETKGQPVIHVADTEPPLDGTGVERPEAIAEVETFDDDDEGDGEIVNHPNS